MVIVEIDELGYHSEDLIVEPLNFGQEIRDADISYRTQYLNPPRGKLC